MNVPKSGTGAGTALSWDGLGEGRKCFAPPKGLGGLKCGLPKQSVAGAFKFPIVRPIARYVPAGEGGATGTLTVRANVYNPSNKLRLSVTVAFEPDTTRLEPAFQAGNTPTWFITAVSRNPETAVETPLQQAYPATGTKNLPDAYEADTGAKLLRVTCSLKNDAFAATYVAASERLTVQLICEWEPNIEMSTEEFEALCALTSVTCSPPKLIQNDAV